VDTRQFRHQAEAVLLIKEHLDVDGPGGLESVPDALGLARQGLIQFRREGHVGGLALEPQGAGPGVDQPRSHRQVHRLARDVGLKSKGVGVGFARKQKPRNLHRLLIDGLAGDLALDAQKAFPEGDHRPVLRPHRRHGARPGHRLEIPSLLVPKHQVDVRPVDDDFGHLRSQAEERQRIDPQFHAVGDE
jgi:hypothetical protein